MTKPEALINLRKARAVFCAYDAIVFETGEAGASRLRSQAYADWLVAVGDFIKAE